MDYIQVTEYEDGEVCEVELEEDGTLALSTLESEFGGVVQGLSFVNELTGNRRVVRLSSNNVFCPPRSGWKSVIYQITRYTFFNIAGPKHVHACTCIAYTSIVWRA